MSLGRWILAFALLSAAPAARASILGDQGVEIEGAYDRRGFFMRTGIAFGASFPGDRTVSMGSLTLAVGAGLSKDTTIGVEGGPAALFGTYSGVGPYADLDVTQFFGTGTFVRLGLGVAPVATVSSVQVSGRTITTSRSEEVGFGGRIGVGQEVWTGATRAFGIAVFYDGRVNPEQKLVSGLVGAAYLAFY